jgi:CRP/FNR family transcriptional regulator, cyclic AMP receptor protein
MTTPPPPPPSKSPERLARAIGGFAPFKTWPLPVLERLARAGTLSSHPPGAILIHYERPQQLLTFVLEGTTQVSITDAGGRRVTFMYNASTMVYGLAPLLDGEPMLHDLLAVDGVRVLRVPIAAVRAELSAAPALWESVGIEMCTRYRRSAQQMTRFVFDAPRVHMAALLVGLAVKAAGGNGGNGPIVIDMRLSQEKLAEMLAISRQWATQLIQEIVTDGMVQWRYGRVTVLDLLRLRAVAGQSISQT